MDPLSQSTATPGRFNSFPRRRSVFLAVQPWHQVAIVSRPRILLPCSSLPLIFAPHFHCLGTPNATATASSSSSSSTLVYQWTQVGGPTLPSSAVSSDGTQRSSITFLASSLAYDVTYTYQLTASHSDDSSVIILSSRLSFFFLLFTAVMAQKSGTATASFVMQMQALQFEFFGSTSKRVPTGSPLSLTLLATDPDGQTPTTSQLRTC